MHYDIVIVSDLHLGCSASNPLQVKSFLKSITFDTLILNGDIIDGWKLRRGGHIRASELDLLKYFVKLSQQQQLVYIRGNHDDFLDHVVPTTFGRIKLVADYELVLAARRYLLIHGDVFDRVTTQLKWIAQLGDIGYTWLLKLNKYSNRIRRMFGLPYYSLSKHVKKTVKTAVNYISDFEHSLVKLAAINGYDGIICGHIHTPRMTTIAGIEYLNSGDWVESMSALGYSAATGWQLLTYDDTTTVVT